MTRTEARLKQKEWRRNFNKWFAIRVGQAVLLLAGVVVGMYLMMIGIGYAVQQHDNKVTAIRQGVIFDD